MHCASIECIGWVSGTWVPSAINVLSLYTATAPCIVRHAPVQRTTIGMARACYACRPPTGAQIEFNLFFCFCFICVSCQRIRHAVHVFRGGAKILCRFVYATAVFQCCFNFMSIVSPRLRHSALCDISVAQRVRICIWDSLESKNYGPVRIKEMKKEKNRWLRRLGIFWPSFFQVKFVAILDRQQFPSEMKFLMLESTQTKSISG